MNSSPCTAARRLLCQYTTVSEWNELGKVAGGVGGSGFSLGSRILHQRFTCLCENWPSAGYL